MRNTVKNFAIAFGLFALVFMIGTCHVNNVNKPEKIPLYTALLNSYKEKVNALQFEFEKQIHVLKTTKDSLQNLVKGNKKTIAVLRLNSKQLEIHIKSDLQRADSTMINDSLKTNTLNYIAAVNQRDSLCNESINTLEIVASKQDSIIGFQNKEKDNLKDLIRQNELRERYLTEQLNTAYKVQRKIVFRNKFLAGSLFIMTGFASALLINQTLK